MEQVQGIIKFQHISNFKFQIMSNKVGTGQSFYIRN